MTFGNRPRRTAQRIKCVRDSDRLNAFLHIHSCRNVLTAPLISCQKASVLSEARPNFLVLPHRYSEPDLQSESYNVTERSVVTIVSSFSCSARNTATIFPCQVFRPTLLHLCKTSCICFLTHHVNTTNQLQTLRQDAFIKNTTGVCCLDFDSRMKEILKQTLTSQLLGPSRQQLPEFRQ